VQVAFECLSNGKVLRGMQHIPEHAAGKVPVVIMFHGFTATMSFMFVELSRLLESVGIASVRFDFAGSGESDGEFIDMSIASEVHDGLQVLDYVKTLDYVDKDRIALLGVSLGGVIASFAAGQRAKDIRALCLICPAFIFSEHLKQGTMGHYTDITRINETQFVDMGGIKLGKAFVNDGLLRDIYKESAPYQNKILIMHGDADVDVPIRVSEEYAKAYQDQAQFHVVQGADHIFMNPVHKQELFDKTVEFLTEQFQL